MTNQTQTTPKITKAQYNALAAIFQSGSRNAFSPRDLAINARTVASLAQLGLLTESNLCYVGSDETLYEANLEAAGVAYRAYQDKLYRR